MTTFSSSNSQAFRQILIAFGSIGVTLNAIPVLLIICTQKLLRDRVHRFFLLLAFAQLVLSTGFISTNAIRLGQLWNITEPDYYSQAGCTAVNFPYIFGSLLDVFVRFCLAGERLLAVAVPIWYCGSRKKLISIGIKILSVLISLLIALCSFAGSSTDIPVLACGMTVGLTATYLQIWSIIISIGCILETVLYVAAIAAVKAYRRRSKRRVQSEGHDSPPIWEDRIESIRQNEKKFTRIFSTLVVCEICTSTAGYLLIKILVQDSTTALSKWVSNIASVLIQVNTILTPLLLIWQSSQLRRAGLQMIFGCMLKLVPPPTHVEASE